MTTWAWPALPVGTFGLPAPALVMPPWIFEVHLDDVAGANRAPPGRRLWRALRRSLHPRVGPRGFRRVADPHGWAGVGRADSTLVMELRDPRAAMLVCAQQPHAVNADALLNLEPGAEDGGVHWNYPATVDAMAAGAPEALEQAHRRGWVWLLSGNVPGWWQAVEALPEPDQATRMPEIEFTDMFPEGAWAASVPLLAHLDEHGVGTRTP